MRKTWVMFDISPCPLDFSASYIKVFSKLELKDIEVLKSLSIGGSTNNHTNSDQMKRMVHALQMISRGNPADLDLAHCPLRRENLKNPPKVSPQFPKAPPGSHGSKSTTEQVIECHRNLHSITAITGAMLEIKAEMAWVLVKCGTKRVLPSWILKAVKTAGACIISECPDC